VCLTFRVKKGRPGPIRFNFLEKNIVRKTWQIVLCTVVIGVAAFATGPMIWPMSHDAPPPPQQLLPAYIAISAIEALAFGFAVAFAVFGWPAIRDLRLGAPWLNRLLFITLIWFIGNWWMHDNLHMHVALDMNRLVYIEYVFHLSLLACGVTLALSWMRLASHAAAGKKAAKTAG
jgi:hypothetical protein